MFSDGHLGSTMVNGDCGGIGGDSQLSTMGQAAMHAAIAAMELPSGERNRDRKHMMEWWQQRRKWRKELENVPLSHLRGMVERRMFYQTPGKQRWAERLLWRKEHLTNRMLQIAGIVIGLASMIVGYLTFFMKH